MEKILKIETIESGEYDSCSVDDIKVTEVSIGDLIHAVPHYQLYLNYKLVRLDAKGNKIPKEVVEYLKAQGWVNPSTVKDREERKAMEQVYYILDEKGQESYYYRKTKFHKVDLDNLTTDDLEQLADGAKIVQVVKTKSVLPSSQYNRLTNLKKKREELAEKRKQAAEKKKEKLKQREIEKAKKILAEAGELDIQ